MLHENHRKEWLDSCVSPGIIDLNVWTIEDSQEVDELLNRNTKRRWKHSEDLVPGWAVAGIDVETGDRTWDGAQFKPDNPQILRSVEGKERTLKYLGATGIDSAPMFLDVPKVGYWKEIQKNVHIPIIQTEGAKKAGASLTATKNDAACISVPGVYAGQRLGRLKPQLKPFCSIGRTWILGYDADWRTNKAVFHALDRQARIIAAEGPIVKILDIPLETKGIDDFIEANGEAAYLQLISDALTYEEWKKLCRDIWSIGSNNAPRPALVPDPEDAEAEAEEQKAIADEVKRLALSVGEGFEIDQLLPPALAVPLTQLAGRLGVPPAAFLTVLLPICSGQIRVGCQLEIDPATDYTVPAILWGCLLGESGSAKSVMLKTVLKPLLRLQKQWDKEYRQKLTTYKAEMAEWLRMKGAQSGLEMPEEPKAREAYVDDSTMETLADIFSNQPAFGLSLVMDELAGLLNGLNQYKSGGKGSDRQRLLTLYGGAAIKKNRKSGRISQEATALSITGTTQPHVLLGLMRGLTEADDGLWARFFWALLPSTKMPPPGEGGRLDINPMLEALYRKLQEQTPHTYTLSKDAAQAWREWHIYTEESRLREQHPTLRAIYPKARERAARVALTVHFITWGLQGRSPADEVSGETLRAAIAFTKWSIGQALLIYADAGISDYGSSAKLAKFVKLHQGQTLTSREVQRFFGSRTKAAEIKNLMQEIATLGYGAVFKKGKSTKIEVFNLNKESDDSDDSSPQTQSGHESQLSSPPVNSVMTVMTVPDSQNGAQKSLKRPKSVKRLKTQKSEKSDDNTPIVIRTVITSDDSQDSVPASIRGQLSSLSSPSLRKEEKGGKKREILKGDRFVLGGRSSAYKRGKKFGSTIFTCVSISETKITGICDEFGRQLFTRDWCFWYPPVKEGEAG